MSQAGKKQREKKQRESKSEKRKGVYFTYQDAKGGTSLDRPFSNPFDRIARLDPVYHNDPRRSFEWPATKKAGVNETAELWFEERTKKKGVGG